MALHVVSTPAISTSEAIPSTTAGSISSPSISVWSSSLKRSWPGSSLRRPTSATKKLMSPVLPSSRRTGSSANSSTSRTQPVKVSDSSGGRPGCGRSPGPGSAARSPPQHRRGPRRGSRRATDCTGPASSARRTRPVGGRTMGGAAGVSTCAARVRGDGRQTVGQHGIGLDPSSPVMGITAIFRELKCSMSCAMAVTSS